MRRTVAFAVLALLAGCHPAPAPGSSAPTDVAAVDSIVLERTPCHGRCPVYRVRLGGDGALLFRTPEGGTPVADRVEPAAVAALARRADRIGFRSLPSRVRDVPALCGPLATDHSTVIVTLFSPAGSHRVEDDLGCHGTGGALRALRGLEAGIDSVAGSARRAGR